MDGINLPLTTGDLRKILNGEVVRTDVAGVAIFVRRKSGSEKIGWHIHWYTNWEDDEAEYTNGTTGLVQTRYCLRCNKLKIRRVGR